MDALALFVQLFCVILLVAIFGRIIASWTIRDPGNPIYAVLHEITEPILSPIRQFMPRIGMFDLSPMVASFLLMMIFNASRAVSN